MKHTSKILFLVLTVQFYISSMHRQVILQQDEIKRNDENNNSDELNQKVTEFLEKNMTEYLPKDLIKVVIDYADKKSECYLKYIHLQTISDKSSKFFIELKNRFLVYEDKYGDIIIWKPNENGLYTKLQEITDWNIKLAFSRPEVKKMIELQNEYLMFLDGTSGMVSIYALKNGQYHVWQTLRANSMIQYMTELKNGLLAFHTSNGEIEIWKKTLLMKNSKIKESQSTSENCIIS